ncbi:MAG: family 16 glycosylhydrolase [Anaerolineales bacterium]
MKLARLTLVILISTALFFACAPQSDAPVEEPPMPSPSPEWELPGWTLVWQDEFDGPEIDRTKWTFDIGGHGWGNNELQTYTERPENVRIEDGILVIEAREEEFVRRNYTSARLKTQGLHAWTYGRIEARMKLPYGNGIWPAFWMLGADIQQNPWPASGEIDIMEHIGREPNKIYGTVHGPGYSGSGGVGHFTTLTEGAWSDDFHVFAIEWEENEIRWYIDGEQFFKLIPEAVPGRWVYDHPFFILINLAVGGNWPGPPDDSTVFPQFLLVDYVRVYQRPDGVTGSIGGGPVHVGDIVLEADTSNGEWRAAAVITVHDAEGNPVEGVSVTGGWVGLTSRGESSAESDAQGKIRLLSFPVERSGEITFCVTSLIGTNTTYDKSANSANCAKLEKTE